MNPSDEDPSLKNGIAKKNKNGISIRLITIDDVAAIFHLGEELFTAQDVPNLHRTWDEYEVVSLFQTEGEYCFAAENEDSGIIGFALGTVIEKSHSWTYGYLLWLGVRPDYQNAGIARRLFNFFKNAVLDAGARIIMVDTEADNEQALNFFQKIGFNNAQEHVFLTMNVDQERRRFEKRRYAKQARNIINQNKQKKKRHDKTAANDQ